MMETAAIIAATGVSFTAEELNPLTLMGSITVIERMIFTFQEAGVQSILVVTGNKTAEIENRLRHLGVVFLYDKGGESAATVDLMKTGLSYASDKYQKILLTSLETFLFTVDTVKKLMKTDAAAVAPAYEKELGYPVMIRQSLIPRVLSFQGESWQELMRFFDLKLLPVADPGILREQHISQNCSRKIQDHSAQLFRPQIKLRLAKETPFFGPGSAQLLRQIHYNGSVKEACKKLNLSYSKGWHMLKNVERELGYPVVERYQGGFRGGKAALTEKGLSLLETYELFVKNVEQFVKVQFQQYFSGKY